eukprot:TRINITY_DN15322_c0_g1_i1.p1 TRINITY_DN15322_c0_g1~~TRINITY_DN15322_c0_g1_i1.p1  ORF type:complete len:131 (+),score=25.84 TRINITY_DN15322_c0_g1_i1:119-511(+)
MSTYDYAKENRIAVLFCILFIYLLYYFSFLPHTFRQTYLTLKLKSFAEDITHKYVYGILFMVLSLAVFPHTYMSVMSYFFFVAMVVALWGHLLESLSLVLIANFSGVIFAAAMGIGLLAYNWEWMLKGSE